MPLVNVKLIEGVFDEDQKQQMIERVTEAMVSVEGESMRSVTWVIVEEVSGRGWGIGGKVRTAADFEPVAATGAAPGGSGT